MSYETEAIKRQLHEKAERYELTNLENKVRGLVNDVDKAIRTANNIESNMYESFNRKFEEMEQRIMALEQPRGEDGN